MQTTEREAHEIRSDLFMIKCGKDYKVPAYVYRINDDVNRYRIGEITESATYNCYAMSRKGEVHFKAPEMRELSRLIDQWLLETDSNYRKQDLEDIYKSKGKIAAIKRLRTFSGMNLKDALSEIDRLATLYDWD